MSGAESELGSVPGDLFEVEQALVLAVDGSTDFEYSLCFLRAFEPEQSSECVIITRVDDRLLVAFPEEAWRKKKNSRAIPAHALTKATRVTVASCLGGNRQSPEPSPTLKVWLGLLALDLEPQLASLWARL